MHLLFRRGRATVACASGCSIGGGRSPLTPCLPPLLSLAFRPSSSQTASSPPFPSSSPPFPSSSPLPSSSPPFPSSSLVSRELSVTDRTRGVCALCDCPFRDWREHAGLPAHVARVAVCRAFAAPDRAAAIAAHLSKHLGFDFDQVDREVWEKERRRRGRLGSTLLHLAERGALREGLPFTVRGACEKTANKGGQTGGAGEEVTVVSEGFVRYGLVGDGYAREETVNRVARLIPSASAAELEAIVIYVLSPRHLARLYEDVQMERVVAARQQDANDGSKEEEYNSLSDPTFLQDERKDRKASRSVFLDGKALVLLSCIGELCQFQRRNRPRSVPNKEVAETLVLHVLASHAIENLISELVHGVLQRILHEGTPVWLQFQADMASKAFERKSYISNPLSAVPVRKPEPTSPDPSPLLTQDSESLSTCAEQLMRFFVVHDACADTDGMDIQENEVDKEDDEEQILPTYTPPKYKPSWGPLLRGLTYDATVLDLPKGNSMSISSHSKLSASHQKIGPLS